MRHGLVAAVLLLTIGIAAARADAPPLPLPPFTAAFRETLDLWDDASGGRRTGPVALNKLQISSTATSPFGLKGLVLHVQVFRTSGRSFSDRVGDIQTVSNIDAPPVTRLFEAWIEERLGSDKRSIAARAGLIDLNADFDSLAAAALFVNSSHGIGADLSRSGRNGPSIFPVTAPALRLTWLPSERWTFRLAAFNGMPGSVDHPRRFVDPRIGGGDGALLIGQADYHLGEDAKIEIGRWAYTAHRAPVPGLPVQSDHGLYGSIESPLPGMDAWHGWLRAGTTAGQLVHAYLGSGLIEKGVLPGRSDDRIGFAVAHAAIGGAERRALDLPHAETTAELFYQYRAAKLVALQPDIQFVHHPAGQSHVPDALVAGLRLVLTGGYPHAAPPDEATDPTVPPDGSEPAG